MLSIFGVKLCSENSVHLCFDNLITFNNPCSRVFRMDNYMLKNATIILEDFSKGIVAHQEDQIQSID